MQRPLHDSAMPAGLLPALAFANFAIGIGAFVVVGVISPIASDLQLSHAQAGMVMSVYALAYAIGSPLAITASGWLDRRSVILVGMGLFLAASVASALAPSASILFAARILAALGAGMVTPVCAAIAVAKSPPERRGAALSTVFLGITIAQVAGIPVGSFLGYSAGWRATFWLVAAISVLSLVAILRFVPRIKTPVTTLASLARTLVSPVMMPAILITTSMMVAGWILFTYFAPLLEERMGYGRDGVTLILIVFGAGAVIGNLMGGRLADRIGPVKSLVLITLALAVIFPWFSLLPMPGVLLVLLTLAWSIVGWAFMVPQQARIVSLDPASQNITLSLNASAIYAGTAIGSWAGGEVLEAYGLSALGISAGLACVFVLAHIGLSIWLVDYLKAAPNRSSE